MLATHLGFYNTSASRTHVRFQFSTHAATGGNVAPSSAFEAADLRIYKASDGADFSATQRSSASGITMTSPFDSLTGFHDVDIDLSDNTDAGFYASGGFYSVVLAPDETVDGQTLTGVVLAYFEIGVLPVNVTQFGGSAGTFSSGRPEVNATHIAGSSVSTSSAQLGVNVVNFGGSAGTFASGRPEVNASHWGGTAVASANVLIDGAITAAKIASDAITSAKIQDAALTAAKFASGAFDAVWLVATRLLTAGTNIVLAKGTGVTGFNDLDAAGVRGAVGLASANLDTQLGALPTAAETADAVWEEAIADHSATAGSTAEALAGATAPSAADVADAVWEEAIADHSGTAGSTAEQLAAAGAAGDPWATALPGAYSAGQAGKIVGDNLNATVSSRAPESGGNVAAIKAQTDNLPASPAATGDAMTLESGERDAVADAMLARDIGSGTNAGSSEERTVRSALRFNRNKFTIAGGVLTVYKEDDTTVAFTAAITQTAGDPVSASDPT